MANSKIRQLYYITHIKNLPSIMKHGILSHERVEQDCVEYTSIYDSEIVSNRRQRQTPDGRSLWSFANLYFQARNPMLYRVKQRREDEIAVLAIKKSILSQTDVFISIGNAASFVSDILPVSEGTRAVLKIWDIINNEWWQAEDGSKRKIMAECLVPDRVQPEFIQAMYVANDTALKAIKNLLPQSDIPVISEPQMFFNSQVQHLTNNLALVEGDMFFSKMQTLTVSVNCVGVMGKGLASRAKYQFPDVYVVYQDLCRQKKLKLGSPYIYKREASLDSQLLDDPSEASDTSTWFLLFPTKHHWRERSELPPIEQGLQWLQEHYVQEGIQSLAIPALGCGLGGLAWKEVGPVLCRYLQTFHIPVWIYLPREAGEIPQEYRSPDYVLGQK